MYKVIALIGKAGSGKDTIARKICEEMQELNFITSFTTRPKREKETEGKEYHFVSQETFKSLNLFDKEEFNGWLYGTGYDSLREDVINIGIFNPAGIRTLLKQPDIEVITYYIVASDKERMMRQLNREKQPDVREIARRFLTDEEDFSNIDFSHICVWNETEEAVDAIARMIIEVNLR